MLLRLRGIEVRQGGRLVLDLPELSVGRGEILAVVGPNGAGKSTLLQVAALLRAPDAGAVLIGGERADRRRTPRLRRRLAMVFQAPLLFDVSVLDNATSGLRFRGVPGAEAAARARGWLDRFGVGHLAGRPARALSGGEAQRVALARAFAVEPHLLLLDEPFSALDAPTRAALAPELMARLRETGTAAIVVTHDQTEAMALGDRLAVLLDGRIAQVDRPEAVVARPAGAGVARFLGVANVLPGRVVAKDGSLVLVDLSPAGPRVRVAADGSDHLGAGDRVDLALQANALRVLAAEEVPAGWNLLGGVVADVATLPFARRLVVDCGVRLTVEEPRTAPGPDRVPGLLVRLGFPPTAAHAMPTAADHRLDA